MIADVLIGSKQEIADRVAKFDGEIREAVVFLDEPRLDEIVNSDIFAEMAPFTVMQPIADDSRSTIYERMEGE